MAHFTEKSPAAYVPKTFFCVGFVSSTVRSNKEGAMGIIGFIVAGLIIGALARLFKKGEQDLSLVMTLLLGMAGALVGGIVANLLGTGNVGELNVLGFIVAVVVAVLLIGFMEKRGHA